MSLLAMIAAMQTNGATPPAPMDPRPTPLDATVKAIRPTWRTIFTARIETDGSGDYPTIADAIKAAKAAQSARMASEGASAATPNYSCRIILGPGDFMEPIYHPPAWSQFYGQGSTRTRILGRGDDTDPRGVMELQGRIYIEGMSSRGYTGPANGHYAVHTANNRTTTWVDFGILGGGYGADGAGFGQTTFYRCDLGDGALNLHGWPDLSDRETICYVDCVSTGRIGWTTSSPTAPSEVWVIGGASKVASVHVVGASTVLHLDPAITPTPALPSDTTTNRDARTDWPVPLGGLSPWDQALYGMGDPDATVPAGTPGY